MALGRLAYPGSDPSGQQRRFGAHRYRFDLTAEGATEAALSDMSRDVSGDGDSLTAPNCRCQFV